LSFTFWEVTCGAVRVCSGPAAVTEALNAANIARIRCPKVRKLYHSQSFSIVCCGKVQVNGQSIRDVFSAPEHPAIDAAWGTNLTYVCLDIMERHAARLRRKADYCRRLAQGRNDEGKRSSLLNLAEDYDRQADREEHNPE